MNSLSSLLNFFHTINVPFFKRCLTQTFVLSHSSFFLFEINNDQHELLMDEVTKVDGKLPPNEKK